MNIDPVPTPATVAALWVLALGSFGVLGWRACQVVSALRRARPESRWDALPVRLGHFLEHVLLQPRLFNERTIGWAHFLIFWGFLLYAFCFSWALLRGLFPFLPVPYPDEVRVVGLGLELFAVGVLIALVAALARRLFYPPPRLHLSLDANLILGLIALLMVTTLLGSAGRCVAEGGPHEETRSVGRLLAPLIPLSTPAAAADVVRAMWWLHMVGVFFFIGYLPYSKHAHLLVAPLNVFFTNLRPVGDLTVVGAPDEGANGAASWQEFTWRQLLGGFACAECGRCDRACPAQSAGDPLSPQDIMQHLKEHFLAEALGGEGDGTPHPPSVNGAPKLAGGLIAPESVWACTTCLACMDCCAVWNEQVPAIVQLRRHLVGQGALPPGVQDVLDKLNRYGNAFGKSDRLRARWAQACGVKIKDARKEPVELVWFVGDYASFDPRCDAVTRATARVFHQAGLDFGLLYDGERNAGNDVRRIGEEGLFEVLREKNQQALAKVRWKNGQRALVTTDPHSYNTLKHEYHWAEEVRVLHSTELFERLFTEGRLQVRKRLTQRVTYHDPCYLGRYNGVYAPPRRVLARLGLEVVEMPRHHHRSYCCGAGGGRIWMDDTGKPRERPAESRVREAASLSGVSVLVVACPKDIAMFGDALKTTGQEGTLAVKEVAELVWEAVASPEPQPAT